MDGYRGRTPCSLRVIAAIGMVAALAVGCGSSGPTQVPPGSPGSTASASVPAISTTTPAPTRALGDPGVAEVTVPQPADIRLTKAYGQIPINEIIVTLASDLGRADADTIAASLGGKVIGQIDLANAFQISVPTSDEAGLIAVIAKAKAMAGVTGVATNQGVKIAAGENDIWGVRTSPIEDPIYTGAAADGYKMIGVPAAWEYIRGADMPVFPANVGIVDSGLYQGTGEFSGDTEVSYTESDAARAAPEPITYSDGSVGPADPAGGHGTGVNVLVGANGANGGLVGIASPLGKDLHISNTNLYGSAYGWSSRPSPPDPSDLSVQSYGQYGTYSFATLAAITEQLKNKPLGQPKVINLSWGTADWKTTDPDLVAVYKNFFIQVQKSYPDVIFVAAAGNDGAKPDGSRYFPAGFALSNIITVGNVSNDGKIWSGSNRANSDPDHPSKDFEVSVFAPGEESVHGYDAATKTVVKDHGGTSMSAPQVTATIALMMSLNPKLTPSEIKSLIAASARKGPDGVPILAVDKAVFAVLDINCKIAGDTPCPTMEELQNRGAIDAVATPLTDAPGEYLIRGIVQAAGKKGTPVTVEVTGGEITKGETPRTLTGAGELGWTVLMDGEKGKVTVTRSDNGASSVITLERIDINGKWSGTFTITQLDLDPDLMKQAEEQGCTVEELKELVGKPLPMTMEITVDKTGKGTATTTVDMSSIKDADGKPLSSSPSESKITYAGNQIKFVGDSSSLASSMSGFVTKAGDVVSIRGVASAKDKGVTMKATWNAVQGE